MRFLSITLLIAALSFSCTEKNAYLTNNIEIEPMAWPNISGSIFIAEMSGNGTITGYSNDTYFSTHNLFHNYKTIDGGSPDPEAKILFTKPYDGIELGHTIFWHVDGSTGRAVITHRSDDNGHIVYWDEQLSNEAIDIKGDSSGIGAKGDIQYGDAYFFSENRGIYAAKYTNSYGTDTNEYPSGVRIYLKTDHDSKIIGVIENVNYMPVAVHFINESTGFLMVNDRTAAHLLKTIDGGINWSIIGDLPETVLKFYFIDETNYCATTSSQILSSNNGGETWTSFDTKVGGIFQELHIADDRTAFAVFETGIGDGQFISNLWRSTDRGASWKKIEGKRFYGRHIDFLTKNVGIAYDSHVIQYTNDGGGTWKLLLYPNTF